MEAAGLSIGAIGLASLFTICIECFEFFKAGQSFRPDLETALAKLDLEKTRLLIWGNHVGVLNPDGQSRLAALQDQRVPDSLRTCLTQIENLLSNTEQLRGNYGLQAAGRDEQTTHTA